MTASTCATLAGVFPVLLLTVILEGRAVNNGIRSQRWYVGILLTALACGFLGLVLAVAGIQANGLTYPALVLLAWASFAGVVVTSFLFLLFVAVSIDHETDQETAHRKMIDKLRQTRFGRLRLRLGAARRS